MVATVVDVLPGYVNSLGELAKQRSDVLFYGGSLRYEGVNLCKDPDSGPLKDTQNAGEVHIAQGADDVARCCSEEPDS